MSPKYLEQRQLSAAVLTNLGQNMTSSALQREGAGRRENEARNERAIRPLKPGVWFSFGGRLHIYHAMEISSTAPFCHFNAAPFHWDRWGLFQQDRDIICFTIAKSALTTVLRNKITPATVWEVESGGGALREREWSDQIHDTSSVRGRDNKLACSAKHQWWDWGKDGRGKDKWGLRVQTGGQRCFTAATASQGGGGGQNTRWPCYCSVFWFSCHVFPTGIFQSRRRLTATPLQQRAEDKGQAQGRSGGHRVKLCARDMINASAK